MTSQSVPQTPTTPQTPGMNLLRQLERWDNSDQKAYFAILVSQRPVSDVDEEHSLKDMRGIPRNGIPNDCTFNTIYLFEYNGAGDAKRYEEAILAR